MLRNGGPFAEANRFAAAAVYPFLGKLPNVVLCAERKWWGREVRTTAVVSQPSANCPDYTRIDISCGEAIYVFMLS